MTTRSLVAGVPLGMLGTLAILGIATFVTVTAVLHEPTSSANGLFDTGPPDVLTIAPADARQSGGNRLPSLTNADVDALTHDVPGIVAFSRVVFGTAPVAVGSQVAQVRIEGVDPSYLQVTNETVAQGTLFSNADASAANPVALLGQTAAARLFPGGSSVGRALRIRGVPFTVIGVLAGQNGSVADAPDEAIVIPFQTGQVRLFGPSSLDAILLRIRDSGQTAAVSLQVEEVLRQRHQVRSGQPDGFAITVNGNSAVPLAESATQILGRIVTQYRQYACAAKGLCPAPAA